jgi:hypothetical protein
MRAGDKWWESQQSIVPFCQRLEVRTIRSTEERRAEHWDNRGIKDAPQSSKETYACAGRRIDRRTA